MAQRGSNVHGRFHYVTKYSKGDRCGVLVIPEVGVGRNLLSNCIDSLIFLLIIKERPKNRENNKMVLTKND